VRDARGVKKHFQQKEKNKFRNLPKKEREKRSKKQKAANQTKAGKKKVFHHK
jgi:hypothetical protein